MREAFFVLLYGTVTLFGAFLAGYWSHMAAARARTIPAMGWPGDTYFKLALGVAVVGIGLTVLFSGRTYTNGTHGLSKFLLNDGEALWLGSGLIIVFCGQLILVWAAETVPPRWLWVMFGATLAWTAVCLGFIL